MSSILTADRWVASKLTGDTTLMALVSGVWADLAPNSATFPYVVFQTQSPQQPVGTVNNQVIFFDESVMVKAVDNQAGYGRLEPILNRVRAVLHNASGTVAGGVVVGCVENGPGVKFSEMTDGKQYRHLGILFRVLTQ